MKALSWHLSICLVLASACAYMNEADRKGDLPYFDLSGFIKSTVKDSATYSVEKSITINGAIESKQIAQYAIWKDLKDFDTYDINRPALFDKYMVDTIQEGSIRHIIHTPINDQLKVRLLKISYDDDDGQISTIEIKASTKSFLEDVSLEIIWHPAHGYVINRHSNRLFKADPSIQIVEVNIR
ncbi:MAG: hypothetical protein IPL46_26920 [Saprospiraceae bacterium]|nr:hypothetical protein [Saprospiraceae bacterium]